MDAEGRFRLLQTEFADRGKKRGKKLSSELNELKFEQCIEKYIWIEKQGDIIYNL